MDGRGNRNEWMDGVILECCVIMGNAEGGRVNAGMLQYMQEQFAKVVGEKGRTHLLLSEVLQLRAHEDYPLDFRHLGVLFVCDRRLDGVFSMQDFEHFALWVQLNLSSVQMYEFKSQLQARTVARVVEALQRDGEAAIVAWFMRMLLADKPPRVIRGSNYVKIEAIKLLYEILSIKIMSDLDIQSFFFLVKRSAQELGFPVQEVRQAQEEEDYDEYIEVGVCKQFILYFLRGAAKILKEIGYTNSHL